VARIDMRATLPRADWDIGHLGPKTSVTVHWNGPPVPTNLTPRAMVEADARFHISKDWSPEPGVQGGDGIMYHRLYAPNGDVFLTREDDAVLWACGNAEGNRTSLHVQVMIGEGQHPSAAALWSLGRDLRALALPVRPHRFWSLTQCPGDELAAWVAQEPWKEADVGLTEEQIREIAKDEARAVILNEPHLITTAIGKDYGPKLEAELRARDERTLAAAVAAVRESG